MSILFILFVGVSGLFAQELPLKDLASTRATGAVIYYPYQPDMVYSITTAPGVITTVLLEPGEELLAPPAAGEQSLFSIAQSPIKYKDATRTALFIKAMEANKETNMIISTGRRTYFIMLSSTSGPYMFTVAWDYPTTIGSVLPSSRQDKASSTTSGVDHLTFSYKIVAVGTPGWKPTRVIDDGSNMYIFLPHTRHAEERPALYALKNQEAMLINYRVEGDHYVVEGLYDHLEMRIGNHRKKQEVVRIIAQTQ